MAGMGECDFNPHVTVPQDVTDMDTTSRSETCLIDIIEIDAVGQLDDPVTSEDHSVFHSFDITQIKDEIAKERGTCWPRLTEAAAKIKSLHAYEACYHATAYNVLGPRVQLSTNNNMMAWQDNTTGHRDDKWLLECVKFGFPMQYRGPALNNNFTTNHPSAVNFQHHVSKYVKNELALGAIIGPFEETPLHPGAMLLP